MRSRLLLLALLAIPLSGLADDELTPEQKKALAEMDARIARLKAEGKLAGPAATDTSTAAATATAPATAAPPPPKGCFRLEPGHSTVVRFRTDESSPTGTAAAYGLSRPKEDTFVVELNPHFVEGAGYASGLDPAALDLKFREKVADCFKEFDGLLKNERAGRAMTLRLAQSSAVPSQAIEIRPPGFRSSSHEYAADITCPAILHESLHLLGLPDEYHDTPELNEPMMDCRPASPPDSIMSDQDRAAARTMDKMGYSVEMCRCEKKGDACLGLAEKNDGRKCPPGTASFLQDVDPKIKTSLNALNTAEAFVLNETRHPNRLAPPEHSSALYPAHFRAITEPGCEDVNKIYYQCVANAYRSSKQPGGCAPKPPACQWGSYKWLE